MDRLLKTIPKIWLVTSFCLAALSVALPTPAWSASGATDGEHAASPYRNMATACTADIAVMMNPDGVMVFAGGYRRWIQDASAEGIHERYVQAGFGLGANPAFAKGSLHVQWQPASFFNLHLEYDLYGFFGDNYGLLSFPDARARFGTDELKDREGSEEKAVGHRVLLQPTLYAKAGPVVVINQTDLAYYRFGGDGPYFLDLEYDTLVRDGDHVLSNRTQFLAPLWKGSGTAVMYAGPYYEITHARRADLTRQRVGGLLYWVPTDTFWGMKRPRIYSQLGVNIQDRNRQDEMYAVLGVGMDI